MEEIARVALAACADSGFVLAGGNALIAHNIGDRPTHDVDLFTNVADRESFDSAPDRVTHALEEQGAAVRRVDSGGHIGTDVRHACGSD